MKGSTWFHLLRKGQLRLLFRLVKWADGLYALAYIAALFESGLMAYLATGPKSLAEIARHLGIEAQEALEAYLQVGVRLKVLGRAQGKYRLSPWAARLARPENDALVAITQEIVSLHHKLIVATPRRLQEGRLWELQDQEGRLIARSSRVVEPLQRDLIAALFPAQGAVRLLEVGCGSGVYLKYAAEHNPNLMAIGVELQEDVIALTQENIAAWGLQERVRLVQGDIRHLTFEEKFDIVTLYNNIYYFPVADRVALLERLRGFLKPGGFLVLTTACQGGQPLSELLNLWGASTAGCGRLPYVEEMVHQWRRPVSSGCARSACCRGTRIMPLWGIILEGGPL